MGGAVHNPGQEFWQPPLTHVQPQESTGGLIEVCDRCGSEFVMGSRFCHVCGEVRGSELRAVARRRPAETLRSSFASLQSALASIRLTLGLGTASLLAFLLGAGLMLAAVFTGILYSTPTQLDWQAVQLWRIEWLLAAAGAFLAGILLKRSS